MTCLPHVLLVTVALAGMACSATAADSATGELVWFGTYTQGKSGSEGIYVARFDAASGELSPPVLAAAATNPKPRLVCPTDRLPLCRPHRGRVVRAPRRARLGPTVAQRGRLS